MLERLVVVELLGGEDEALLRSGYATLHHVLERELHVADGVAWKEAQLEQLVLKGLDEDVPPGDARAGFDRPGLELDDAEVEVAPRRDVVVRETRAVLEQLSR